MREIGLDTGKEMGKGENGLAAAISPVQPGPTTFLCADCGVEVRMDWTAPCFGLCEACEVRIREAANSWRQR